MLFRGPILFYSIISIQEKSTAQLCARVSYICACVSVHIHVAYYLNLVPPSLLVFNPLPQQPMKRMMLVLQLLNNKVIVKQPWPPLTRRLVGRAIEVIISPRNVIDWIWICIEPNAAPDDKSNRFISQALRIKTCMVYAELLEHSYLFCETCRPGYGSILRREKMNVELGVNFVQKFCLTVEETAVWSIIWPTSIILKAVTSTVSQNKVHLRLLIVILFKAKCQPSTPLGER